MGSSDFGPFENDDASDWLYTLEESSGTAVIMDALLAIRDIGDEYLEVPDTDPELAVVLANVHLELLAYHAAAIRDRAIDKPRNLAKSVTVE